MAMGGMTAVANLRPPVPSPFPSSHCVERNADHKRPSELWSNHSHSGRYGSKEGNTAEHAISSRRLFKPTGRPSSQPLRDTHTLDSATINHWQLPLLLCKSGFAHNDETDGQPTFTRRVPMNQIDLIETFTLRSGARIPAVGFGIWKIDNAVAANSVRDAIEVGYRHIDSACDYGNEVEAGQGIASAISDGLVTREDLWVTSKLWNTYHRPEHVRPACEKTLQDLGLDELDLYLMHFPISLEFVPFEKRYPPGWFHDPDADNPGMKESPVPILETWQAMTELVSAGLVREIGVCNFGTSLLRDLMASSDVAPSVLQVELHPYLTQEKLVRFCNESEIHVTGFSPLGALSYFSIGMAQEGDSVLDQEVIKKIAVGHDRSPAQVVLRWAVQRGTSIVPKTTRKERMVENLSISDFELSDEEMNSISVLDQHRRFNDPGDFGEAAFNTFFPIYD